MHYINAAAIDAIANPALSRSLEMQCFQHNDEIEIRKEKILDFYTEPTMVTRPMYYSRVVIVYLA